MKISVSEITIQASNINNKLKEKNNTLSDMLGNVNNIINNDSFSGPGYESAKTFFSTAYVGVIQKFIDANNLIINANISIINRFSSLGVSRIDTDELQSLYSRIRALEEEMNRTWEEVVYDIFGNFSIVIHRGPDRTAEISNCQKIIDQINLVVRTDAECASAYAKAEGVMADVKTAIARIKTIMYNKDTNLFDYTAEDITAFSSLLIDEKEGTMETSNPFLFSKIESTINLNSVQKSSDWKSQQISLIQSWRDKYGSNGVINVYGNYKEQVFPPNMDQAIYVTKDGKEIPYFWQRAYGDYAYSVSDLNYAGCGPSAAAMVITALKGEYTTPDMAAGQLQEMGTVEVFTNNIGNYIGDTASVVSDGTHIEGLKALLQDNNVDAELIGIRNDASAFEAALDNGDLAIVKLAGASRGNPDNPYTYGGHYVVAYPSEEPGMVNIIDSNKPENNGPIAISDLQKIVDVKAYGNANVIIAHSGN